MYKKERERESAANKGRVLRIKIGVCDSLVFLLGLGGFNTCATSEFRLRRVVFSLLAIHYIYILSYIYILQGPHIYTSHCGCIVQLFAASFFFLFSLSLSLSHHPAGSKKDSEAFPVPSSSPFFSRSSLAPAAQHHYYFWLCRFSLLPSRDSHWSETT